MSGREIPAPGVRVDYRHPGVGRITGQVTTHLADTLDPKGHHQDLLVVAFPVDGADRPWHLLVNPHDSRLKVSTVQDGPPPSNPRPGGWPVKVEHPISETRCAWITPPEEPESRLLLPGCYPRVQDWDAECVCPTTAETLLELEAEVRRLATELKRSEFGRQALRSVVLGLPDGAALLEKARKLHWEWIDQQK